MYGSGSQILRIGSLKLFRWTNGAPTLQLTCPGYVERAPKLRYGWTCFFAGHYGQEKTIYSYKKEISC